MVAYDVNYFTTKYTNLPYVLFDILIFKNLSFKLNS